MRAHLKNAAYGMLDYLAYPLGMIAVAPIALRALGVERYGVWMVASAAVMTGGMLASGFGDANTRAVAMHEAAGDHKATLEAVQTTLGIHMVLGAVMAILGLAIAPWMTDRVVALHSANAHSDCLWSLRLASILMLARAVESASVSTQRAFGRYGVAIGVSLACRLGSLTAACILPLAIPRVSGILIASTILCALGTWIQFRQLKQLLGVMHLLPRFARGSTRRLMGFGIFTWLQAVGGLLFGQGDRLIAGAAFGAASLSSYALCAQLSQPVYGISAAALHFLFPYLTSKEGLGESAGVRRGIVVSFAANAVFVALGLTVLLLFGNEILRIWGGETIARHSAGLLPILAWSAALSALTVAPNYAMLALGQVRTVTFLNLLGGIAMLASTPYLLPHFGIRGMGLARLLYCPFSLMVYLPLAMKLRPQPRPTATPVPLTAYDEAQMRDILGAPADSQDTAQSPSTVDGINKPAYARILGVAVDAVDMEGALAIINSHLASERKGLVCAVSVHGILEALRTPELAEIYAQSILNAPDGTPTVWIGRLQGLPQMDHVTGPALMKEIFSRIEFASRSHFLYGGRPGVAEELASSMLRQFPWVRIAGTYTPPFRDLTSDEEQHVAEHINALHPDVIWVGISTPRQELWMRRMLPRLSAGVMFGVGAAFDFHTGRIRECPQWLKRAGFHWLHRLMQDPRRLWRRNLHNMSFFWYFALQLIGLRKYPITRRVNRVNWADDRRAHRTCSDAPQAIAARWSRR